MNKIGLIKQNKFSTFDINIIDYHSNVKNEIQCLYLMNSNYYTKKMAGASSIKKVLPALFPNDPSLGYHNLDLIHNGSEAMNSFRAMESMSKEELLYTRENLLKYCCLDTYAMVKILAKLKEVVK